MFKLVLGHVAGISIEKQKKNFTLYFVSLKHCFHFSDETVSLFLYTLFIFLR